MIEKFLDRYEAYCDNCNRPFMTSLGMRSFDFHFEITNALKRTGWKVENHHTLCPHCKNLKIEHKMNRNLFANTEKALEAIGCPLGSRMDILSAIDWLAKEYHLLSTVDIHPLNDSPAVAFAVVIDMKTGERLFEKPVPDAEQAIHLAIYAASQEVRKPAKTE